MGAFTGIKDAKRGFYSNFLRAGKNVVRIDECVYLTETNAGQFWKNTLTILAVIQGDHKVGEVVHTMWKFEDNIKKKQIFQQNVKSFLCGVLGAEDSQIDEAKTEEACSEKSPMHGLVTVVTGVQRASKEGKQPDGTPKEYTVFSWEHFLVGEEIEKAIGAEAYARFFPNG